MPKVVAGSSTLTARTQYAPEQQDLSLIMPPLVTIEEIFSLMSQPTAHVVSAP